MNTADNIAQQLLNHVGEAASDIAYEIFEESKSSWMDADVKKWAAKARKAGCRDLAGAYADHLYNDACFLQDMIGDKLFDETNGDDELHGAVLDILSRNAHTALVTAIEELRR